MANNSIHLCNWQLSGKKVTGHGVRINRKFVLISWLIGRGTVKKPLIHLLFVFRWVYDVLKSSFSKKMKIIIAPLMPVLNYLLQLLITDVFKNPVVVIVTIINEFLPVPTDSTQTVSLISGLRLNFRLILRGLPLLRHHPREFDVVWVGGWFENRWPGFSLNCTFFRYPDKFNW